VPVVAIVAGILVRFYYADHEPAHFHAVFGEDEMLVRIADLTIMAGGLPPAQRRAIFEWALMHQNDLALAWVRCRQGERPGRIE